MGVTHVVPSGPAAAAGLQRWDIITSFDGKVVASSPDFLHTVRGYNPGDLITLRIVRFGQEGELIVRAGNLRHSLEADWGDLRIQEATSLAQIQLLEQHKAEAAAGSSLLAVSRVNQLSGKLAVEQVRLNRIQSQLREIAATLHSLRN